MVAPAQDAQPLAGQRVAFTGRLASMSRAQAVLLVQTCGGEWHQSIQPHTSLLVVGQEGWPLRQDGRMTAKLQKARRLQRSRPIAILTEADFLARVGSEAATNRQHLSTAQLSQILKIPGERLRGWVRLGLVQPIDSVHGVHYFDFRQVSWAKSLADFGKAGVTLERIRRSLEQLKKWLPGVEEPLAQLAVVEKDSRLLVRLQAGQLAEPSGQGLLDFAEEPSTPAVKVVGQTFLSARSDGSQECLPHGSQECLPHEWFQVGCEEELAGRPREAARAYRQALRAGGPNADTCFNLANVLYQMGRRGQAIERYAQVVELEPAYVDAWNNLGNVLVDLEQYDEAVDAFRRVLELSPLYADAHYNLADTLDQLGRVHEAVPHWQAYMRHDPASRWGKYARRRLSEIERPKQA